MAFPSAHCYATTDIPLGQHIPCVPLIKKSTTTETIFNCVYIKKTFANLPTTIPKECENERNQEETRRDLKEVGERESHVGIREQNDRQTRGNM